MRIAIFTNNYLPNPFGVSMSIESFRKEFERLGHTVYIFAPAFKGYIDENENACLSDSRVFRYLSIDLKFKDIRFPIVIPYSYRIGRILEELEIDVIHSQHPNLLGWQAKRWAKKKNVPLVFTWHTLYDQYAHFVPLVPEKIAAWWAIGNAVSYANKCDQVIVPTKSIKKIINDWGVENKNIVAIPTGVEESFFENPERETMRKQLEISDDEIVLLLMSRMTAEKNVQFLVRSVIPILKKNKKVKFILAGEGIELPQLRKMIAEAQLENQVIFQGIASREVTKNIYAASDIFVYASKSETQGMIISEAMCLGLPVVAVNATGAKDLVTNHVTGLLVDENRDAFSAAVKRLVDDEELRNKFSQNAKIIALENYTSEICSQEMLEVYKNVIERKQRGLK